jgi:hypothetical protein
MRYATASWNWNPVEKIGSSGAQWKFNVEARPWRVEGGGEICAHVIPENKPWADSRVETIPPLCALAIPTWMSATRNIEGDTVLEHAWLAKWPIAIAASLCVNDIASLPITYHGEWPEENPILQWIWREWERRAGEDQRALPPNVVFTDVHLGPFSWKKISQFVWFYKKSSQMER